MIRKACFIFLGCVSILKGGGKINPRCDESP